MTEREIIRCGSCNLVQFVTRNGCCRRCCRPLHHVTYQLPAPEPEPVKLVAADFGQQLRALRRARGWTQQQLEKLTGYSRSHLLRLEHGYQSPNLLTLYRIAAAFDLQVGDFFRVIDPLSDWFVREVAVVLPQLQPTQRSEILKVLQAIVT